MVRLGDQISVYVIVQNSKSYSQRCNRADKITYDYKNTPLLLEYKSKSPLLLNFSASRIFKLKEAVQLSDKLCLFNSKFYQEFDGVNIFCQKLTLLV